MISPDIRFGPAMSRVIWEGEATQVWFDYDTRRAFVVQLESTLQLEPQQDGPDDVTAEPPCSMEEAYNKEEMLAQEWFQKHPDELGPDVTGIRLDSAGELLCTFSDPDMSSDVRRQLFARYPTLASAQLPAQAKTILRSELIEVDRLWRNVDLVSFTNDAGKTETGIFKYFTEMARARHHWAEHKLLLHLPPHPLLPRYTRTVLDENSGRVVGFCAEYFSGRNLLQASPRVLKLSWLKELMHLVDELNLTCGMVHGDIWPANLMVNEATDEIKLLDFGGAQPLVEQGTGSGYMYDNALIDVQKLVTTVYRIIAHKLPELTLWAEIPTWDWPQHPHTKLDHSIPEYQRLLSDWVARRQELLANGGDQPRRKKQKKMSQEWPCRAKLSEILKFNRALCCPPYKPPPVETEPAENPWVTWERPATKDLVPGVVMLANGKKAG